MAAEGLKRRLICTSLDNSVGQHTHKASGQEVTDPSAIARSLPQWFSHALIRHLPKKFLRAIRI